MREVKVFRMDGHGVEGVREEGVREEGTRERGGGTENRD